MCQYWLKQYKGLKNGILVTKQLKTIWNKLLIDKKVEINNNTLELSNSELMKVAHENKMHYINYYRELQRHDKILRREGLKHLKEIRKQEGKLEQAAIIEKIYKKEMTREDWRISKHTFNPILRSGISNVEIPDTDSNGNPTNNPDEAITWKRLTDPIDIEDKLVERNIRHFGQAEGILFTSSNLRNDFDYEGVSSSVDRLLDGNYTIPTNLQVMNGATHLIHKLGDNRKLPSIHDGITLQEFQQGFKRWKEGTSTSPSDRHLGHYKSLLIIDGCKAKYDEKYQDPSENIMQVYYQVASSALNQGISLTRWQHSITAMIEKIPGSPKVNKLRVIHLYEADYNLLLKIIWARRLVWYAHDGNRINDGQAGSRPGRNSIDVVIQKEMKYLFSCLSKTGLATMDNEAKSCYDRIICTLAMIISQYFDLSSTTAKMQATTLKTMQFRLRIALGDSTKSLIKMM